MSNLDFFVFSSILLFIAFYGIYKNYQNKNLKSYILGDKSFNWTTIGLSVMATQASAITFISTPGQGYAEGMSFIQNYFGMPIALIVVSIFFIPRYYGSKVFTAYEYLEERFDLKTNELGRFVYALLSAKTTQRKRNNDTAKDLILTSGDIIKVTAGTANRLHVIASLVEIPKATTA